MTSTLALDIETYSPTDLKTAGVFRYVEDPDFEIILIGYSFDDEPEYVLDLTLEEYEMDADDWQIYQARLARVLEALTDPDILKTAHNAPFEMACLSTFFKITLVADQWECTMVKASMLGLPLALEAVARILELSEQKSSAGKQLIKYFSIPCKPTIANGQRTRNMPYHAPYKWRRYKVYCRQDVRTEKAIKKEIRFFEIPEMEKKVWRLDYKINSRGILMDRLFINTAINMDEVVKDDLYREAAALTGLSNPNSAAQLKEWLTKEMPLDDVQKLRKEDVPVLREAAVGYEGEETIQRVLDIRLEMSKTSSKKYAAMLNYICADDRIRGMHQYYGANRTGRWAGRGVQPQNMYKNKLPDLDLARKIARTGDLELLDFIFGNVPDVLSQLIRTAFVAPANKKFLISDFSAIEARVIAWLAGETWRLDVFKTHGKIYEASAAMMFKVPIEAVTKTSDYRAKGKISELALGFQGGIDALIKMGAVKMGVVDEALRNARIMFDKGETVYADWDELETHVIRSELKRLVDLWRAANKKIVKLWYDVEDAALSAVENNTTVKLKGKEIYFKVANNILWITLPSGRSLCYQNPRLREGRFNKRVLIYDGMNQTTKQWSRQDTYGGKLVENIVQAIARDCLAMVLIRLDAADYLIDMHVHDEIVIEAQMDANAHEVDKIMSRSMEWAPDLPLGADTTESLYYRKD